VVPGNVLEVELSDRTTPLGVTKVAFDALEQKEHRVKLFPPYSVTHDIVVPPHKLRVTFFERTNPDWRGARLLEKFHYRGMGLNRIVGRRSVLLAKLDGVGIVGYGVVSSSVLASKPRFRILKTNVGELMRTKFINKLVRIPRIVIHPEFRGIGLGVLMARQLVEYVKERWDVNGYRPVMVEVIAAMTEYHRFFQAAGFLEAGYTEGYKGRAIEPHYGSGNFAKRSNTEKYNFMVDQGPKPYLVFPLTPEMTERVRAAIEKPAPSKDLFAREPLLKKAIRFTKVSIAYKAENGLSSRASRIRESFGVDTGQMYSAILRDFNLTIEPGDTVLLAGASGSGKSTMIRVLGETKTRIRQYIRIEGRCPTIRAKVAVLSQKLDNSRLLIDQVGSELHDAIRILNGVGLAEAHLYLKRPNQISEGQRYRFSVAQLCESGKPIWIADEFASTLDPLNAAIVAKGLRRLAFKEGATCIIAAPHIEYFAESLVPNVVVRLRWGGVASIAAVRARIKRNNDESTVRVRNSGLCRLTQIKVGGVDPLGRFHVVCEAIELAQYRQATFYLPIRMFDEFSVIKITTSEGVGEIFYLR
jgi:ABC-type lipoprotein export system ATPase subunit/GNAT superfamily N-acetyltransferase